MALSCAKILNEKQMAERLGISEKSLQRLRSIQKVPWHPLMGKPYYYEDEVVEAFLNDQLNRGITNDQGKTNKKRHPSSSEGEGEWTGALGKLLYEEGS